MMWQKARHLKGTDSDDDFLVGRVLWVLAERPVERHTTDRFGTPDKSVAYETNLVNANGHRICARASCIELLPEFLEEATPTLYEDWIKEAQR